MKKHRKEAILISYLQEKEKYKRLAEFFVRLILDDPSSPKESLHSIIYRLKDELRLIEKISTLNTRKEVGIQTITARNYQASICDLAGIRIICLRLSDIEKIEAYLNLLVDEHILNFVKGPDQKRSFILPADLDVSVPAGTELGFTGYSSIHYQIQLGENADAPEELKSLHVELQLRTILEEAWSEIDHKYRYVRSRIGVKLPEHIHAGFYNLSAYLQVAAMQAEYLCRSAESCDMDIIQERHVNAETPGGTTLHILAGKKDGKDRQASPQEVEIEAELEEIFRVKIALRTTLYVEKRLRGLNYAGKHEKTLRQLLKKKRLLEFKAVFQEIFSFEPFMNAKDLSIDIINALNFAIFYHLQGKKVAQEGLRVVLRWRKNR